jgi:pyrimidine operon attenuation protein/uracil phosphoribosyltransferase
MIGIRTRGETLAKRIVERLGAEHPDRAVHLGVLDITFYRDDLSKRRGVPLVRATEIEFDLDKTWCVLIDDVLQTGRSIRAALDALHDYGRPEVVRLGVLIDRGGREVPIAADYVGTARKVPQGERIQVKLKENDGQEGAYICKKD